MKFQDYPVPEMCTYCGEKVILTTNDYIYGRRYYKQSKYSQNCNCYVCVACKASVGTHADGTTPLGRLANAKLKVLKMQAHSLFDPIWQSGEMRRGEAYAMLVAKLRIPKDECHFGWFDEEMLLKAREILKVWRQCDG